MSSNWGVALIGVAAAVGVLLLLWIGASQRRYDGPNVEREKQTERRIESEAHATSKENSSRKTAVVSETDSETAQSERKRISDYGAQEASEYWSILGRRIKITDTFIALFTGLLVVGTLLLWWSTHRSVRIAERALAELERPVVVFEIPDAGLDQSGNEYRLAGRRVQYQCANYGRTPALLTELLVKHCALDKGGFPDPVEPAKERGRELPSGCISAAGHPYIEGDAAMKIYGLDILRDGEINRTSLYFIGYVGYRDIFGRPYIHGFCLLYDPISKRYVRRGDNEKYNYTRRTNERVLRLI